MGFFVKTSRKNIDDIYHEIFNNITNFTSEEFYKLEGDTHDQDILEDESVDLGDDNPSSTHTITRIMFFQWIEITNSPYKLTKPINLTSKDH
jgi:hypothetical protein